jgi:glutaminyl-peptide cyclotransferase
MQSPRQKFERYMSKYQLPRESRATNFVPVARVAALIALVFACGACARDANRERVLPYEIVAMHPHDSGVFTQGLLWHDGRLFESAGQFGQSAVLVRELRDAAPRARRALAPTQFGEGLATDGKRLLQLTWRSGIALAYDFGLRPLGRHTYEGEGWGLAYDGQRWLMSDGSSRIVARDRESFAPVASIEVTSRGRPVTRLNELEFARGRLYANIWYSDRIAVINPADGVVEAWIDLGALRKGFAKPAGWNEQEHVLNGIAFDPRNAHFFVTGKCWPVLFEIRVGEPGP